MFFLETLQMQTGDGAGSFWGRSQENLLMAWLMWDEPLIPVMG